MGENIFIKITSRNHKKFSSFSANKEMSLLQREFYSIPAANSGLQLPSSSSPFTEKVSISFNEDSLFLRERWQLKGGRIHGSEHIFAVILHCFHELK
jgi:hypothetical protein